MSRCRWGDCGARILWCKSERGASTPVDAIPSPARGNIVFTGRLDHGVPIVRTLHKNDPGQCWCVIGLTFLPDDDELRVAITNADPLCEACSGTGWLPRYLNHYATCTAPEAQRGTRRTPRTRRGRH